MKKYDHTALPELQMKIDRRFGKGIYKAAIVLLLFGMLSLAENKNAACAQTQETQAAPAAENPRTPQPRITITDTGQTATLNNITPAPDAPGDGLQRITSVYFAKKNVTANGTHLAFTRIDSAHTQTDAANTVIPYDSILGKTVYLVAETSNLRSSRIDFSIRPAGNNLTGNTDTLSLMRFEPATRTYAASNIFTAEVGNFDALNNNTETGSHAHYSNLEADHADKVIIKLQLRPATRALFNDWLAALRDQSVNLEIVAERHDNQKCAYGESTEEVEGAGVFLNDNASGRLRVTAKNVYEIYHGSNAYNFFPLNGTRRRRVKKIDCQYPQENIPTLATNEVVYFYYDEHDNEHRVCSRIIVIQVRKRRVPVAAPVAQRGRLTQTIDYTANRAAGEGIDAYRLKIYENGTLGEGTGNDKWYANQGTDTVQMIDMDILANAGVGPQTFEAFNYNQNGTIIRYGFVNTRRRSIRPDLYAGFLGSLAQFRQEGHRHYIVSQGFSYADASCYPSAEHVNGEAGDLNLLTTQEDGVNTILTAANYDYDNEVILRDILYDFGFLNARSERASNRSNQSTEDNEEVILPHATHTATPRHNNHLHVHGFNLIPDIYT